MEKGKDVKYLIVNDIDRSWDLVVNTVGEHGITAGYDSCLSGVDLPNILGGYNRYILNTFLCCPCTYLRASKGSVRIRNRNISTFYRLLSGIGSKVRWNV